MKLTELGDESRVDVIMTNPPFGGEEEAAIKNGYPADKQTSDTALLFLQLIMRRLKRQGGRAAVVVPNGVLFGDGIAARIKHELLTEFNLHTIVRLPKGVFEPYADVATNLLFFDRSGPTHDIWFYEHPLPEGRKMYTKLNPLRSEEFIPLLSWWSERKESALAWRSDASTVIGGGCNLDIKNPSAPPDRVTLPIQQLLDSAMARQSQVIQSMKALRVDLGEAGGLNGESA